MRTERLLLRAWRESDLDPFARLNDDPRVMEFLPARLTRAESDEFATRIRRHFDTHGFGLWAVEAPGMAEFIGYVGLSVPSFMPVVEIGWRLAHEHWGRGYATEAARAVLDHAFGPLGLKEVVSFTVPENARSRRVMERIGMKFSEEFDHPRLPEGHRLRRHVLYRVSR